MHDDELMDRLLTDVMAADAPQLSPTFDARVMRGARPHRPSATGLAVIVVYAMAATVAALWLMRDLPLVSIAAAVAIGVPVAAGAGAYGRRLVAGH